MTTIVPISFAQGRVLYSVNGLSDQVGFGAAVAWGAGTEPEEIATKINTACVVAGLATASVLGVDWAYEGVVASATTATGPVVSQHFQHVQGTSSQPTPPPNCTVLVRKNTAKGGRENRGRLNLPSGRIEEASVDSAGFLTPAVVTALNTTMGLFKGSLDEQEVPMFLLHSDPAVTPTAITTLIVQPQLATQRRRMR